MEEEPLSITDEKAIKEFFRESNRKVAESFFHRPYLFHDENEITSIDRPNPDGEFDTDNFFYLTSELIKNIQIREFIEKSDLTLKYEPNAIYDEINKVIELLKFEPNNSLLYQHLGKLLLLNNDIYGAQDAVKKAIALDPEIPEAHFQLSLIYDRKNKVEEAIEEVQSAICLDPDNQTYYRFFEKLLMRKNRQYL